jgi:hypothetical protein
MRTRLRSNLVTLAVLATMAILWCGCLSLVWRNRQPVLLKHVDHRTVESSVWTRGRFPAQATDITVWYVRGENI